MTWYCFLVTKGTCTHVYTHIHIIKNKVNLKKSHFIPGMVAHTCNLCTREAEADQLQAGMVYTAGHLHNKVPTLENTYKSYFIIRY